MQTKCTNCGLISPLRTDICDKCGGMSFAPLDSKDKRTIGEIVNAKEIEDAAAAKKEEDEDEVLEDAGNEKPAEKPSKKEDKKKSSKKEKADK